MKKTIQILLVTVMIMVANKGYSQYANLFQMANVYNTTGGGSYCAGGTGVSVGLSGSEIGIQYYHQYQGINSGIIVNGTGFPITFGLQTLPGIHTITSYDPLTGCWLPMAGSVTVIVNALPSIAFATSGSTTFCQGGSVTITGNVTGGSGVYNYLWQHNGTNIPGATFSSYTAGPLGTGMYKLLVSDGVCTNNRDTLVTVNALPQIFNVSTANANFCQNASGTLSLSGSEIGLSYQVKNGLTNVGAPVIGTGAALSFTGITVGGVPLTIVATNTITGCSSTMAAFVTFTIDPLPSNPGVIAGPVAFCEGSTVTYSIAPVLNALTYSWIMPNGTYIGGQGTTSLTISGTPQTGVISVLATNACGNSLQQSTISFTINPKPIASITSNPANATICNGSQIYLAANGGTIATWYPGGFPGLTYNPAPTVNTTYTAIVSNVYGCADTANIAVIVNPTPTVSLSTLPFGGSICQGQSATMTASGATTYVWNDSYTLPVHQVSPAVTTTYTVVGTTNGCTSSAISTITVHTNPVANITSNPASATICNGGSVTLTASGAANYLWNTGDMTASITDMPTFTTGYIVTVTDAFGCSGSYTEVITVNPNPVVTASANTPVCAGSAIQLSSTTTIPGTFGWTGPGFTSTQQSPSVLNANTGMNGTYTVTTTTGVGCIGSMSVTVVVTNPPTLSVAASDTVLCSGNPLMLLAVASGGTISWTGPSGFTSTQQNPVVTNPSTGNYVATAALGGCQTFAWVNVLVNPLPSVVFNTVGSGSFMNTDPQVQMSGLPAGGVFTGMGVFNDYFYPVVAGVGTFTLTYTYTDPNGCSNSATTSVTIGAVGVDEITAAQISIYPNPTSNVLNIKTGDLDIAAIQLYDVIGKMIFTSTTGMERAIDMANFPTGIYYLRISTTKGDVLSSKVVKQ